MRKYFVASTLGALNFMDYIALLVNYWMTKNSAVAGYFFILSTTGGSYLLSIN